MDLNGDNVEFCFSAQMWIWLDAAEESVSPSTYVDKPLSFESRPANQ